jgi:D-sedoheptulose 7-phosphate isomerase
VNAAARTAAGRIDALLAARVAASDGFFAAEADALARTCHRMAERFAAGGRLVAFGETAVDASDVRHVAVEFVHPVIVGKRALPALGIDCADVALLARPEDIVMPFGTGASVAAALERAVALGCLPVVLRPPSDDPFVAQEVAETAYHVLWELVHVFFEHRGLLSGGVHDSGASAFLYPFLGAASSDLEAVLADVQASAVMKASEASALRTQTLVDNGAELHAAAASLRASLDAGGAVLALGNGGSATDAMDAVADLKAPPSGWPPRPALDLTADSAILTAITNDVGVEPVFARQVIAYGRPGDALLAFSTSGGSANVIAALAEARRRGLVTVAMVGYDGGAVLADRLADHVIVSRSEHIPRIQEAQASAWHVLRELIEQPA